MIDEFLGEIRKEFRRKDKDKDRKVEKDIWGGIDSFCDRYSEENREEEVRQVEIKKKEIPIVVAITPRKQMARRGGKSGYWMR